MLVQILELNDPQLEEAYKDFEKRGGVLKFYPFKIIENYQGQIPGGEYQWHLVTARQALEKACYEANFHRNKLIAGFNRSNAMNLAIDHQILEKSGFKMTPQEFLGYSFEWETKTVYVKGKTTNSNWYFPYNLPEEEANRVQVIASSSRQTEVGLEFFGGFAAAFLNPPYGTRFGETIFEVGQYFNQLTQLFFGDLTQITVYNWSIDCCDYFKPGKEWWGSYFWTVYNPGKDIYVGIIASETD